MTSAELDPAAAPQRLQQLGSWLINQAGLRATRIIGVRFGEVDARRDQYAVMVALDELGQASQADLGRRLMLDRSDMSALIDELESAGHVVRERDAQDRRRNVIRLTDAGTARLRELDVVADAVQDDLLAPLSPGERDELVTLLQRLVAHHR
jgi:DNA-binding MarR family transcriptional regulator